MVVNYNNGKSVFFGLLILSDLGIGNFDEIEQAKKYGFSVIIIDHHEILNNKLPKADIVIDPKQSGDEYNFKFMAACGLCLKLSKELLKNMGANSLEQGFYELATLGTIADMMLQESDNKKIIEKGLSFLPTTRRPSLGVLIALFGRNSVSEREVISKIISLLQITDFKKNITESYILLTASDKEQIKRLILELVKKNLARRELIDSFVYEIKQKTKQGQNVIFEGGSEIDGLITGSIASKVCNIFQKPVFIYSSQKAISRGSVRAPKGVDAVKVLRECEDLLEVYGGHPPAAGFTVKNKNIKKFKEKLEEYFKYDQFIL